MKNLKAITLVVAGLMTLVACGGKQDSQEIVPGEGAILAVRTFEDVDGTEQEGMTEVAILEGDFNSPEQAQLAAESAQWTDIASFELDDEVDFESIDNSLAFLSEQTQSERFGRDGRDDRDRGDRFGRDGRDGRDRGDRFGRDGGDRRGHDGDARRFRRGHHHGGNWRPNNYRNRWQHRPYRPAQHRFYGFQRCTYRYIYRHGSCYRPVSRRWGYNWTHGWGYTTTYRGRRPHQNRTQLRVRVRFFL